MKEKLIQNTIIVYILLGPITTLIVRLTETMDFSFYIFPVTIDSIDLRPDPEQTREWRIGTLIIPFFNIKILVFGLLSMIKTLGDKTQTRRRFFIMLLLLTSIRFVLLFLYSDYNSDGINYYFGLLGHILLITGIIWVLKKRTHNNMFALWPGD